jgi:hypothetical protein
MKTKFLSFALTVSSVLASTGLAQLATISPFPGQSTESFESFPTGFTTNPLSILGGTASVEVPVADGISIYEALFFVFSLGSSSENAPGICALGANGPRGLGLEEGFGQAQATITFTTPVNAFGGFWGAGTSETNPATITMRFFDATKQQIGVPQSFTYLRSSGDGMLEWHGWSSDVPIAQATLIVDGPTAVVDDLRISLAPHFSSISRDSAGIVKLIGHGLARASYTVQAKTDLNTTDWMNVGATTTDGNGAFQFVDEGTSGLTNRFYRLVQP